ncbi:dTDP-4-dehydrorhamnose reductase [Mangrovimonas yunxiaonensis]|uniref:dTDP-4-dehydrorhamnose reductase n=1 Tax=Mangrovimonas yunxiaonensis TaxID=1197477 RepID=A0A084THR0_9FLAO|nr:sugar nucleotide-binding protein [Mangrovimonas yunxiaonensis]KFB00246.1 dTDP-4-dehydrorhamnose reductase [Mangrovimonas yunxiaonensis]MBR9758198.1 sugar nucleotide-binding protein [Algicola sp.]GGH42820.1 hypothetical protein GCM10011364_14610 [Mangrovimonas yunxiaonensis]
MKESNSKHNILILGASGFLGHAIYKELCSYFNTFGTYRIHNRAYAKNQHFLQYDVEEDDVIEIIQATQPTVIISALRGDFSAQVTAHKHIFEYLTTHKTTKIIFLSSANVFDAYSQFPSYEYDKTFSQSIFGHFKIKIEDMLMRLPKKQYTIVRLPMVFGTHSPRILELKTLLQAKEPIEVFPNLIMNATTDSKVTQQIHYIINRNKSGVYHLGSTDLVHHDDFIKDLVNTLGNFHPVYKQVYTTNNNRYLAVLPKHQRLPKHLQLESKDILQELSL